MKNFHLNDKLWVEVMVVTFLDPIVTVHHVLTAKNNDLN